MKTKRKINVLSAYATCLMLAFATPLSVYAEEGMTDTAPSELIAPVVVPPEPATPPAPEPAAPEAPAAPAPAAPVAPEPPETFEFDPATQKWNSNKWQWDSAAGKYVPVTSQTKNPESPELPKAKSSIDTTTNTAIANALDSIATSGAAGVNKNTTGGSATSGNTTAAANIINNVNSTMSNSNNKEAASFVMDIMGDVNGDIMLEPMLLKAMIEARASGTDQARTINSSATTGISNDVELTAQSGDATVSGNTNGGDATSGSARAMANVMNMVNSMIAANQSFDGTINIYGNLNGDILIAPDFLAQMLASNGIPASANGATKLNARDTQEIVNNVTLAADSGAALVSNNTNAGSATSGDANTNLVIFNMTGHDIVAENSLLVFINVLGSWVGVIVDAPTGSTAAALASGVEKNSVQPSMTIEATNESLITNDLTLKATSGSASVTGNTNAGNAKSGNATASANIANISNSQMGLSGWFGRLFINVFGSWNGSFGVNTSAGDPQVTALSNDAQIPQFIRFVPSAPNERRASASRLHIITPTRNGTTDTTLKQAAATVDPTSRNAQSDIPTQQDYIDARKDLNVPLIVSSIALIIGSGYVLRRFLF